MMRALQSFASPGGVQIFGDAARLPLFFEHNLLDPSRVVKHFHSDPQANLRVFYYQYLKLCFELENVDFEGYIRRIEELINNEEFKFIFYEEDDPEVFKDLQFKQLIMEFFGLLGQGGVPIQQAINYYPIMDTVFIYFFRALLILTGRTDALDSYVEREELFQFLCSYFSVDITIHDRCIKFVDSDIFVYEEDPKDVYMAYMEDPEDEEVAQQQHASALQYSHEQYAPNSSHDQYEAHEQYNSHEQYGSHEQYNSHEQYEQEQYEQQEEYTPQDYSQHEQQHQQEQHHIQYSQLEQPQHSTQSFSYEPDLKDAAATAYPAQQATPIHDISYHSSSSQRGTSEINKSYISSEFVDYTHPSGLQAMVKKDLKESAEISKQPTFGKILDQEPRNPKANSQIAKAYSPEPPYESPLAINAYLPAKTDLNPKPSSHDLNSKPTSHEFAAKPGSNYETAFTKKEESAFTAKAWEAPPTKDPGFSKAQEAPYQPPVSVSTSKKYAELLQPQKPPSYNFEQKYEMKKPPSTFQSKPVPNSYLPASTPYTAASNTYTSSNTYASASSYAKPASPIPVYKPPTPQQPSYPATTTKSPYNLNVSIEFTNSFTMKAMAEPFRTNVRSIRSRARDFRNSLMGFIK